jgi:hypothetical protein
MRYARYRFLLLPLFFMLACVEAFAQASSKFTRQPQPLLPRNRRAFLTIFACAILSILSMVPNVARAQLYAGSLSGVVADPTGALVVNAAVTLTDVEKGFTHEDKTDASGRYSFRALPPTVYKLTIVAQGFETEVRPAITVNVNENATANITLKIGQSSETVEVQAGSAEGVDSEDASNGQVVDQSLISALPLVGRAVFDLAFLAPGVSSPAGGTFGGGGQANNFISQGSRNGQADILIDGITTTNYDQNGGWVDPLYTPSVDAVQEFKIQQTNFSAEFGFSGSTVINVVTRSGSNKLHGSAYDYLRNTVFNSNDWFSKQAGEATPAYHWNDFGFTASGPIKKDKIFFFFDYEGHREIYATVKTLDLPTDRERGGDFGQICSNAGGTFNGAGQCSAAAGQIWDPYQWATGPNSQHLSTTFVPYNNMATYTSGGNYAGGTGLPGGVGNLINPVTAAIFAGTNTNGAPYIPHAQNQYALHGNYTNSAGNVNNGNQFDAKVDYQISPNDNLSARWSSSWGNSEDANIFNSVFDSNTQGPTTDITYQGSVNYTHTFSSNTLLTATFGATHSWANTAGVHFDSTTIGVPADVATNPVGHVQTAPSITIGGYAAENNNGNFGGQEYALLLYGQDLGHLEAAISHVIRNHELKAGGEVRLHRINFTQWGIPNGRWDFESSSTAQDANNSSSGGDSIASFLTGFSPGWGAMEDPASPATQNYQYAGFVQDNWKVNHKLTVNAGFRYDLDMPRTERHDRMSYFDPTLPSPIASEVSGVDPTVCPACNNLRGAFEYVGHSSTPASGSLPAMTTNNSRYPYNVYHGAVGPRLGFAYAIMPTTAIRGGVGIYYDPGKTGAAGTGAGGGGFQGYATQSNWTNYSGSAATGYASVIPDHSAILGQQPSLQTPYNKTEGLYTELGGWLANVPINTYNTLPREFTWSLGFEHEFRSKLLLDADYIGKHGQHLYLGGFTNYADHIPPSMAAAYHANPSAYAGNISTPAALNLAVGNAEAAVGVPNYTNPIAETTTVGIMPVWAGSLPYPQFSDGNWSEDGIQNVDPPIARSNFHGIVLKLSKPLAQGLQFLVSYTAQQSFDNGSSQGANDYITPTVAAVTSSSAASGAYGVQDPNAIGAEYSLSQFSIGQIAQGTFVYQIPFGEGRHWSTGSGLLDDIFGNWQTSGSYRWDSGQPLSSGGGGQAALPGYNTRPNMSGQLKKSGGIQGVLVNGVANGNYFQNPQVFTQPADYTDGSAPRNLKGIAAPGTDNFNLAVDKSFPLHFREGMVFKFRWEAFNLFNHVQYAGPNTSPEFCGWTTTTATCAAGPGNVNLQGSTFGEINSQANSPLIQQVSLRITF